jgi:xanthine dehydrogenase large subunit
MNEAVLTRHKGGAGAPTPHDSAYGHVDGAALYIDDMPTPTGCLHAHLVQSKWARARITRIDVSKARAMPGVRAIATAADIKGPNEVSVSIPGEPLLPSEIVEYVGHPVAMVVAETEDQARRAAAAVVVEAEPLPAVLTVQEALEKQQWVLPPVRNDFGADPAPILATAPHRFKGEIEVGGQDHFYLEGQVALALPVEGGMEVWSSTQHPGEVQTMVARILELPASAVTCLVRRMGGGFGGKESQAIPIACLAALGSSMTGRAVKLRLERDDDMMITGKRHPFLLRWDVGTDDEGRILAVDMLIAANAGWSCDLTPGVLGRAVTHACNSYYYPSARIRGFGCRTNFQSHTAFRGFGGPQGMMGCEAMMEQIARSLGKDPLAVRRINMFGGPGRDTTPYLQKIEHFRLPKMIDDTLAASDFAARRKAIDAFNAANPVVKKGLATSMVTFGISFNKIDLNQGYALVLVYEDGSVLLNHGGTEMGQGLFTKVAQVVAEVFAIDVDKVRLSPTSTAKIANASPTAASSGADLNGMAAKNASEAIKQRMTAYAAQHFDVAPEEVVFENNHVRAGNHKLTFGELAHHAKLARVSLGEQGYYRTPGIHWDYKTHTGSPFFYYSYGVAVSEVAVDTLTGEWKALRTDILHDCGNSLNPQLDRGQIEGAFIQGLGLLTMEELVWDKEGRLLTHAPSTYKIPSGRDLPRDFRVELLQNAPNEAPSIYRSKAVGEPPLLLAISVWLALVDAIAAAAGGGVPRLDTPATGERILKSIARLKTENGKRA